MGGRGLWEMWDVDRGGRFLVTEIGVEKDEGGVGCGGNLSKTQMGVGLVVK